MQKLLLFIRPATEFVRTNIEKIILILVLASIFAFAYYLTDYSLKRLKVSINSYYPFNKFFPESGQWSVLYFLIVIIFLAGLVYFFFKGGFYLQPA